MNRKLSLIVAALGAAASGSALAVTADCPAHPRYEWTSESAARSKVESQGIEVRKTGLKGNCFAVYGKEREGGRKVVLYLDTKTLETVSADRAR